MNQNMLKEKLLEELSIEYEPFIDHMLETVNSVIKKENYFHYLSLVKNLKALDDLNKLIEEKQEPEFVTTSRTTRFNSSYKRSSLWIQRDKYEKEITRLVSKLNKKSKKEEKEEEQLPFEIDNELDCAVYMLIFACQFLGDKNYDDIEERKANSMYPMVCKNPLYNESLTYDEQYKIVNDTIDKYTKSKNK